MVRPSVRPAGRGGAKNYTRFALPVYVTRRAGAWPGIMYRSGRAPTTNATFPPALAVGGEGGGGAPPRPGERGGGDQQIARRARRARMHAAGPPPAQLAAETSISRESGAEQRVRPAAGPPPRPSRLPVPSFSPISRLRARAPARHVVRFGR